MKNDARFFDFLELSPRGGKPRKQGMTTIGDEGESVAWLRSMLEIWGDYADSVKFVPALLMMPNRVVEERVKRLPQSLRQPLTDEARQEVVGAAGRKARDQAHRPRRISLRPGEARRARERSRARGQAQKPTA
jgi:(2R)-phospho-3-sulfolactate synthase (ComA)